MFAVGMGLFFSPNQAGVMNSLPPDQRGAGAGMLNTFQNSASVLSMGLFFTIVTLGLAARLPGHLYRGPDRRRGGPAGRAHGGERAADRQPVLRVPRLQPDQAAARPDRRAPAAARPPGRVHHRPVVLPQADRGALRGRPAPGVHVRLLRHRDRDFRVRRARPGVLPRGRAGPGRAGRRRRRGRRAGRAGAGHPRRRPVRSHGRTGATGSQRAERRPGPVPAAAPARRRRASGG